MCVSCQTLIVSSGLLAYVVLNIRSLPALLANMRKHSLWVAGVAVFVGLTAYLLIGK